VKPVFSPQFAPKGFNLSIFFEQFRDIGHGFHGSDDIAVGIMQQGSIFQYMDIDAIFFHQSALSLTYRTGPEKAAPFFIHALAGDLTNIAV